MPLLNRLRLLWASLRRTLWWRPALWSAAAVAIALLSALVDRLVPAEWLPSLNTGVVDDLLNIMASSMLVVSTFALSVLASAYASAANAGTPRATSLVVADPRAQKSVAVFLAAFVYSLVGVIALGVGNYGSAGRMMLFVFALGVLAWVLVAFMTWIDVLSRIGQVGHTIATVEAEAREALHRSARQPLAGAQPASGPPQGARAVLAEDTGHVHHVDVEALQELAEALDGEVHVVARPGDPVHPRAPLAWWRGVSLPLEREQEAALRSAFLVGPGRVIGQDAAYGLIVLAEVAQRALSPGINDPGTAIAVLGSQTRLLIEALAIAPDPQAARCSRVTTAPQSRGALVPIAYESIARNSLGQPDVMHQWLIHLDALASNAPVEVRAAVRDLVGRTLARAERAGVDGDDLAGWRGQARAAGLLADAATTGMGASGIGPSGMGPSGIGPSAIGPAGTGAAGPR